MSKKLFKIYLNDGEVFYYAENKEAAMDAASADGFDPIKAVNAKKPKNWSARSGYENKIC